MELGYFVCHLIPSLMTSRKCFEWRERRKILLVNIPSIPRLILDNEGPLSFGSGDGNCLHLTKSSEPFCLLHVVQKECALKFNIIAILRFQRRCRGASAISVMVFKQF
ncbi:unnamed protein product [Rhizopus microsporus]